MIILSVLPRPGEASPKLITALPSTSYSTAWPGRRHWSVRQGHPRTKPLSTLSRIAQTLKHIGRYVGTLQIEYGAFLRYLVFDVSLWNNIEGFCTAWLYTEYMKMMSTFGIASLIDLAVTILFLGNPARNLVECLVLWPQDTNDWPGIPLSISFWHIPWNS